MTQALTAALLAVITSLAEELRPGASEGLSVADIVLGRPKSRDHGDWASNAALKLAKNLGVNPREFAVEIAKRSPRRRASRASRLQAPASSTSVWIPPPLAMLRR